MLPPFAAQIPGFVVAVVAFAVALPGIGCATPAPLVRLEPLDAAAVIWVGGRAAETQEQGSVRAAAAFERQEGNALAVRLEVENRTSQTFEVTPHEVTFSTCLDEGQSPCSRPTKVIDPEATLQALDERRSVEEADAINTQAFHATLTLLSVATDVASIAAGKASPTTGLVTLASASQGEDAAAAHSRNQQSFGSTRELWSNAAFRRSTLLPGRGVAGLVFVPIDLRAKVVRLEARAGSQVFRFSFRQTVTTPVVPRNPDRAPFD